MFGKNSIYRVQYYLWLSGIYRWSWNIYPANKGDYYIMKQKTQCE